MIWSDRDIQWAITAGHIDIKPEPDLRGPALQPSSLELGLGEPVSLRPGEFRLSHTLESVSLAGNVAAQLNGKSSLARLGLMIHSTGGWIDPGFCGQIVLELKNIGGHALSFDLGAPIAQLIFHPLSSSAVRPYGHPELKSHYQGQQGNRRSWLDNSDA